MRIAVSYNNGNIFQHFGQTNRFKLYDAKDGCIIGTMEIEALDCGHEALASFLGSLHVNMLICGGIGGSARAALEEAGVLLYGGVTGSADEAVAALLAGTLVYDPNIHCKNHDGEAHTCGHACGSHPSCAGCHEA